MNPYANEEVMWQRLKDMQLEAETRRQHGRGPGLGEMLRLLAARAWILAGLAMRRPPRPGWVDAPRRRSRAA
jgi:hypothetical protein